MSLLFVCRNDGGRNGCNKNVPWAENKKSWDIPNFAGEKKMGYPKNCPAGIGTQSNKKCDLRRKKKRKSAFRKTCLPLKG